MFKGEEEGQRRHSYHKLVEQSIVGTDDPMFMKSIYFLFLFVSAQIDGNGEDEAAEVGWKLASWLIEITFSHNVTSCCFLSDGFREMGKDLIGSFRSELCIFHRRRRQHQHCES